MSVAHNNQLTYNLINDHVVFHDVMIIKGLPMIRHHLGEVDQISGNQSDALQRPLEGDAKPAVDHVTLPEIT